MCQAKLSYLFSEQRIQRGIHGIHGMLTSLRTEPRGCVRGSLALLVFFLSSSRRPSCSTEREARSGVPKAAMSGAQFDAMAIGEIKGLRRAGWSAAEIAKEVKKTDGTHPQKRAVEKMIRKLKTQPKWRGTTRKAGGRPTKVSAKTRKALVSLVTKERGQKVVTVKFCKRTLPALRKVDDRTVARALHVAGFPCGGEILSFSWAPARPVVCNVSVVPGSGLLSVTQRTPCRARRRADARGPP